MVNKRLLFIMNPNAGMKQAKRYTSRLMQFFSDKGYICTVFFTSKSSDAYIFAKNHLTENDLVVVSGGDGTFNEVVSAVLECGGNIPVGYIPAGSTNDFANSVGLSKNIMQAARDITDGKETYYDAGLFENRFFTYVASFGAFTRAAYATPQNAKNMLGRLAYFLEGLKDVKLIKPVHLKIQADDKTFEGEYIFGSVSNSHLIAGILSLDDRIVNLNDGMFELLLIEKPQTAAELQNIIVALTNHNFSDKRITLVKGRKFVFELLSEDSLDFTLDGEYAKVNKIAEIKNLQGAIKLIKKT